MFASAPYKPVDPHKLPENFKLSFIEQASDFSKKNLRICFIASGSFGFALTSSYKFGLVKVICGVALSPSMIIPGFLISTALLAAGIFLYLFKLKLNEDVAREMRQNAVEHIEKNPGTIASFLQKFASLIERNIITKDEIDNLFYRDIVSIFSGKSYSEIVKKWGEETILGCPRGGIYESLKNKYIVYLNAEIEILNETSLEDFEKQEANVLNFFDIPPELIKDIREKQEDVEHLSYIECISKWGKKLAPGSHVVLQEHYGTNVIRNLATNTKNKLKQKYLNYLTEKLTQKSPDEFLKDQKNVLQNFGIDRKGLKDFIEEEFEMENSEIEELLDDAKITLKEHN